MSKEILVPADAISQKEAIQGWNEAAEEFASRFEKHEEFFHKYMINPTIIDLLGAVEGKAVLDMACGEGHFSRKLAEMVKGNIQITGVDASETLIEIAKRRNKDFANCITFQVGDASRMDQIPSHAYDIVICNMALMFIKQYEDALREVARVLKPRGIFVFSLLHPCFLTPGSDWIMDDAHSSGKGKRIGWKTDNYHLRLASRDVMFVCDTHETYYFCRTLEDYFRALRKQGLLVTDLREPLPPKAMMERKPEFQAEVKRSLFLIMKGVLLEDGFSL
ncbi:MAG: 16S rRNA (cytosine(1402)-N(4))-methyltransferase [Deltaproteobacteria bacterium RBG_13_52_11]|nr:MAG: 16S rRNA (cytosine(1402)-N(4))-methyltransferase [Deltaproteobacteria bacterium RBG_13_52_11]